MIVRVLGEGRYDVADTAIGRLEHLDRDLTRAVDSDDEAGFTEALSSLVQAVRDAGRRLPSDDLQPSELVVPNPSATLQDVQSLLAEES